MADHDQIQAARAMRLIEATKSSGPRAFAWGHLGSHKYPVIRVSKGRPSNAKNQLLRMRYRGKNRPDNCDTLSYKFDSAGTLERSGSELILRCNPIKADSEAKVAFHKYFQEGFGLSPKWGHVRTIGLTDEEQTALNALPEDGADSDGESDAGDPHAANAQTEDGAESTDMAAEPKGELENDAIGPQARASMEDEVATLAGNIRKMNDAYGLVGGLDAGALERKLGPWFEVVLKKTPPAEQAAALYNQCCRIMLALCSGGALMDFLGSKDVLSQMPSEPLDGGEKGIAEVVKTLLAAGQSQVRDRGLAYDADSATGTEIEKYVSKHWPHETGKRQARAVGRLTSTFMRAFRNERQLVKMLKLKPLPLQQPPGDAALGRLATDWRRAYAQAAAEPGREALAAIDADGLAAQIAAIGGTTGAMRDDAIGEAQRTIRRYIDALPASDGFVLVDDAGPSEIEDVGAHEALRQAMSLLDARLEAARAPASLSAAA